MIKTAAITAAGAAIFLGASAAFAAPVLMSAEWAAEACKAWNKDPVLTDKLFESGWIKNDQGRGYKLMHVFRSDCKDSPRVELRIARNGARAECAYGGKTENAKLDAQADYLMHAETARWTEMGKGEYGPMRAMMFGRLQFEGPKMEAMSNMGPFENFLLLVGKVPGDIAACPQ